MKYVRCFCLGLLFVPALSFAADPSQEACYAKVVEELVDVHDTYRSVVFGSRRDKDGKFEVLTGGKTNEERVGIFEIKRRLGSELVEPLVESYRVYRCRSLAVCTVLGESLTSDRSPSDTLDVKLLGCAEVEDVKPYPECFFGGKNDDGTGAADAADTFTPLRLVDQCQQLVEQTLAAERSVLRLAVGYDAGYRAMLQFSGIMDWMLEGFPTQAVKAVGNMVNLLGKLHQIPCFIGQCDNPDSDFLKP